MANLIAIDMDGTLLSSNNKISEIQVKYLLNILENNDNNIAIATGRPLNGIKNCIPIELFEKVYKIALNGSLIVTPQNEILDIYSFHLEEVKRLIDISELNNIEYALLDEKSIYTTSTPSELLEYDASLNKMRTVRIDRDEIVNHHYFTKVLYCFEKNQKNEVLKIIPEKFYELYSVIFSQDYLIEFLPKNIDKGHSLERLSQSIGIIEEDTIISIGDGLNDESLLKRSDISIAMGNAVPKIKNMTDFTTDTNNNNGVMKALERLGF